MVNIKIGEVYDYFDDGKIKPSRRYKVKIKNIIPFDNITNKILKQWTKESKQCAWIYNNTTDFFIIGEMDILEDINKEMETVIFVRARNNTWFSLGIWAGYLDVDGSFLQIMLQNYPE